MPSADIEYLISAEIDGELDPHERGALARRLLADPEARAHRDSLRQLCATLDAMPTAEPPLGLAASIVAALPEITPHRAARPAATARWRFAAMIGAALVAAAVVFAIVDGSGTPTTDTAGTLAAAPSRTILQTVHLEGSAVTGDVSLYRAGTQFGLEFNLTPGGPFDVRVRGHDYELRLSALARGTPSSRQRVELPGLHMSGQPLIVTFMVDGRETAVATLETPKGL
jgi:hypothetical protein